MANEICDNCDKTKKLAEINYLTKRKKIKMLLCEECLGQFAEMVVNLAEEKEV